MKIPLRILFAFLMGSILFAQTGTYSGGGDGSTVENSIHIATLSDLIELSNTPDDWDLNFLQTSNIIINENETAVDWDNNGSPDGAGTSGFSPIGNGTTKFTGYYNGQGYVISNLFINRPDEDYIALFGYVQNATIFDLGVCDVSITGDQYVAGFAGKITGSGNSDVVIEGCYTTGEVNANSTSGDTYSAGFAGWMDNCKIQKCFSHTDVTGKGHTAGFAAIPWTNASIHRCYSRGDVTRINSTSTRVGGFAGTCVYSITHCYSTGKVLGTDSNTQGFVGQNFGTNQIYENNFFDAQTSEQNSGVGATAKTTDQMKTQSTYTDWDFAGESANGNDDIWTISATTNDGYPYLTNTLLSEIPLPICLEDFSAIINNACVELSWETASETENAGYILERKTSETDSQIIANYLKNNELLGHGTTAEKQQYQWSDLSVQPGKTYTYRLADVDFSGTITWHEAVEITVEPENMALPAEFGLQKAYPNPFNPSITLDYNLTEDSRTTLGIYNMRGQLVQTLENAYKEKGMYSVKWHPQDLSSGVYIVQLRSGGLTHLQKVVYVK